MGTPASALTSGILSARASPWNVASPPNVRFPRLKALPCVRVVTKSSLAATREVGNLNSLTSHFHGMVSSGFTISSVWAMLFTVLEAVAALSLATFRSSSASNKLVVVSLQFRKASFAQDGQVSCASGARRNSLQFQRLTAILALH